jgi:hypothetical protein
MSVKEKIIKHLDGVHDLERQTDSGNLIDILARRYDTDPETVEKILAEWSSGRKKQ